MKLDELDREILRMLINDGRSSLRAIARVTRVSPGTVRSRLKKLVKSGVIRRFTVSIDWAKLGMDIEAILLIDTRSHKNVGEVAEKLSKFEQVKEVHSTTGSHDILAMVVSKNMEDFRDFMENTLGKIDEISNVYTAIVMKDFKEE